jgi:putative flippase GtrA
MATGELLTQPSKRPTRKVGAAGLGGAAGTLVLWALSAAGIELDAELAGAVATLTGFITAYFVRDRAPPLKTPARRR